MPEPSLQTAFEIKTQCDEISRQLLRWHWEQRPGSHTFENLLQHIQQRREESPDYYDRLPDLSGKTSWQQLDTTLCMRVLLDPEQEAARPLDLLGQAPHSGAARRACHAVRNARNEAAHAGSPEDAQEAARIYADAIDCLAEAYLDAAFTESELTQYAREAQQYLTGEQAPAPRKRSTSNKSGQKSRSSAPKRSTAAKSDAKSRRTQPASRRSQKKRPARNWGLLLFLLAVALVGLWVRAAGMKP